MLDASVSRSDWQRPVVAKQQQQCSNPTNHNRSSTTCIEFDVAANQKWRRTRSSHDVPKYSIVDLNFSLDNTHTRTNMQKLRCGAMTKITLMKIDPIFRI